MESTNTGPAIAERFMWPMHMHMEERRAQLPAELAGAHVMTGSTSNFQELEAEEAEEQHQEEQAEAAAAQVSRSPPAKPHLALPMVPSLTLRTHVRAVPPRRQRRCRRPRA